ncbi:uncharacterized protein B0H18DRAFT_1034388 [Fomitopsis serialis]|uniref:uncharacterized protein n=1 Tax=Fomitopsis serialis TaxID=139415 RepID=UPI002007AAD9|nr:uncharacterized protein B0H18DRAFT_1034388 [Neoantrodia serialis]KAH9917499.1 hypothetical protein B0H18DRAFT_1034388 [Neoantrodia serialis]
MDYVSCFLIPLPSLFLSRFLLNLHASSESCCSSLLAGLNSPMASIESLEFTQHTADEQCRLDSISYYASDQPLGGNGGYVEDRAPIVVVEAWA